MRGQRPTKGQSANLQFKRKLIASAVASTLLGGSTLVTAQGGSGEQLMEEVIVTGIKGSLQRAMDVKRDAQGVVDAITAEDIGKMPDTNLAESLQRITGVSIDRANGEGSRVTVRGFGPEYNVVTLNGRHMPAANIEDTGASASRSFDFAQLAPEAVSGVQVYKTGRANLPTGGIGSVINVQTTRPLDISERIISIGGKILNDSTNEDGDDYTPEVSGIYADKFADGMFGVAIAASYAERDSGFAQGGTPNGWFTIAGGQDGWGSVAPDNASFTNPPQAGEVYSVPRNINYAFGQIQRERTNALLTLQWMPSEQVAATLDYTYSEYATEEQRHDFGAWFNGNPVNPMHNFDMETPDAFRQGSFTRSGGVAAPVIYADFTGNDFTAGAGNWGRVNELTSIALNVEWRPMDNLTLSFDHHSSEAENGAADDRRGTNNIVTGVQYNRRSNRVDYSGDLPILDLDLDEALDRTKMLTSGTSFRNSYMKHEIDQTRFDGVFELDEDEYPGFKSIDFGLSVTSSTNRSAYGNADRGLWNEADANGYGDATHYPDSIYSLHSLPGEFSEFSTSGLEPTYIRADWQGMVDAIAAIRTARNVDMDTGNDIDDFVGSCAATLCAPNASQFTTDRTVEEDQLAAYVQANFAWEGAKMPMHISAGLRYEDTDVDAKALVPNYSTLYWQGDNEFIPIRSGSRTDSGGGSYSHWLPNVDFDIQIMDDVVVRASWSKTLTRPGFADLQAGKTINSPVRKTGGTGSAGNPDLDPFESDNFDLSVEWYYAEGSYVSVGYYSKDVENFIGEDTVTEALFNLPHPYNGPRAAVVREDLAMMDDPNDPDDDHRLGREPLDGELRARMEQLYAEPVAGESTDTVVGDSDGSKDPGMDSMNPDPAVSFALTVPVNVEEAEIDGWELAWQHMFSDTGFGLIFNYTTVEGDVDYDDTNTNKGEGVQNQFALLGLSDSANLVAFYDKYGIQARLAFNWRDDFLSSTVYGDDPRNPVYTEEYSQWDLSIGYDFPQVEGLSVIFEGINITDETRRLHSRHDNMVIFAIEQGARYSLGVRYQF